MGLFIRDGFTFSGKVEAKPELGLPELNFRYRPATSAECYEWMQSTTKGGRERFEADVKLIAAKLVDWDAADDEGNAVPLSVDVIRRLHFSVINKVLDFITGYSLGTEAEKDRKN